MITSAANERLKLIRKLESRAQRARTGLFVAEGEDLVEAALLAGIQPVEALVDAERPVLEGRLKGAELCMPKLLAEVSTLAHPPRVIAVFREKDMPLLDTSGEAAATPRVGLALWHVGDPGNVGTLLRAADAMGPAFVALSEGCADPYGPKALRGSTGAAFRVPRCGFEQAPGRRIGLVARTGKALSQVELRDGDVFVLGAERAGLPELVRQQCDVLAEIPLAGVADSLNVAMAGTIALYEWSRQRGAAG